MKCIIDRTFCGICVGILLCYIISGLLTGKPSFFGYRLFFIMSESMEPTIHRNQIVIAEVVDSDAVEVGDVVAYKGGEGAISKTVIHRVIAIENDRTVILKGDNNQNIDPPVGRNRIMYKIVFTQSVNRHDRE